MVNSITELWFVTCIQWLTLPVWQQQFLVGKVIMLPTHSGTQWFTFVLYQSAYANKAGIQADQVTNCTLSRSYYYSRSADHITISLHQVTPDYRGKCSPPPSLRTRHYSMCMSKTFFRMMQGWQRQKPWKVYRCSVHARQWVLGLCKSFICHVMTDQWGAV